MESRGWSVPYVDEQRVSHHQWHVAQDTTWSYHVEAWRFFTSGQLGLFVGFPSDWQDESLWGKPDGWSPGATLPVFGTIFQCTEIFELAARLALTTAGDDVMHLDIALHGLAGRELLMEANNRGAFLHEHSTQAPRFDWSSGALTRDELVASARELALEPLTEIFARFNWHGGTARESLRAYQSDIDEVRRTR